MRAFHIDMNMAQYRGDYLMKWLSVLADRGYDTIIWEVENNIQWETCPECVSPDAFTKAEFGKILAASREMGLSAIPLFQTIGHGEYVVKHEKHAHLRELPNRLDQYCPLNEKLMPFLHEWIDEYFEVFGKVEYFHIGADEAYTLGQCDKCKAFAEKYSLSKLFINHVNEVAKPVVVRGATPIIWADMVLHYPEALAELSRDIMLFDWMYAIYRGNGKVMVWHEGETQTKNELSEKTREIFGKYLFPYGDEAGREPEIFYTADYLAGNGFKVVTCPGSSSHGDSVFSTRNWLHMINTFDSFKKGMSENLCGTALTSWSVRINPWEEQLATIDIPCFVYDNPGATIEEFQRWFVRERFGIEDDDQFWLGCGLLSEPCAFSSSHTLGFYKDCLPVDDDYVQRMIREICDEKRLENEKKASAARYEDYVKALTIFEEFGQRVKKGNEYIDVWKWGARCLVNRAEASGLLLENADAVLTGGSLDGKGKKEAMRMLSDMRKLRDETSELYGMMIKPTRCDEMVAYMFDVVIKAVAELAGE